LLRKGSLNYPLSQDANKKARRLVDTLSKKDVLPKTLFMSNVKTGLSIISLGGFTTVFKGDHYGRPVTLRVVYKSCNHEVSAFGLYPSDADLFARIRSEKKKILVEKLLRGGHSHTSLSCLSSEYMKRIHSYTSYHRIWRMEH
jgi:hypothetical protein